ncbi:MAG: hypothetical protein K2I42_04550 [Anaeroplasmataceae bacterium]|nr:hypothetical protein [Anaeroplasmataceae bacterium]
MNKKVESFFTEHNFEVKKNHAYGKMEDYEVNATFTAIYFDNTAVPLSFHISCYTTDEQKRNIEKALNAATIKKMKFNFTSYGLNIGLNDMTIGKLIARLDEVLKTVLHILTENGALNYMHCPVCGEVLDNAKKCFVDGYTITIDESCANQINQVIASENEEFENAPNNYLRGFLGACVGGVVGAVIAFILYFVGLISSISAAVAAVLGSFLYIKFGGKKNKGMILIVMATTLVFMMLSVVVVYIVAAGMGADEAGVSMSAIDAFKVCMKDAEFSRLFILDLVLTILFSVLGVSYQAFRLFQMTKRQKQI